LNILDENIIASQRAQLRKWRIRFNQIGTEIGRRGMKDLTEIVPLLHSLRKPTKAPSTSAAFCAIESSAQRNNDLGKSFWHVKGI